jgi:hypothetical protein
MMCNYQLYKDNSSFLKINMKSAKELYKGADK